MVVSQNFSSATSLAMLAPISTLMVIPSFSWITSEMSLSPSGPSSTPWKNKHRDRRCIYISPHRTLETKSSPFLCSPWERIFRTNVYRRGKYIISYPLTVTFITRLSIQKSRKSHFDWRQSNTFSFFVKQLSELHRLTQCALTSAHNKGKRVRRQTRQHHATSRSLPCIIFLK